MAKNLIQINELPCWSNKFNELLCWSNEFDLTGDWCVFVGLNLFGRKEWGVLSIWSNEFDLTGDPSRYNPNAGNRLCFEPNPLAKDSQ